MIIFIVSFIAFVVVFSQLLAWRFVEPVRNVSPQLKNMSEEVIASTPCFVSKNWRQRDVVFLLVHGYRGNRAFYDLLAPQLAAMNAGVVIPAMPGHDNSTVTRVGFGGTESDIVSELAREIRPRKVIAVGVSLGGAAVWQAAGNNPDLFDAVATEGTYPDFLRARERFLARMRIHPVFFEPMFRLAERMTNVDSGTLRPIEGVKKWRKTGKPTLVCHGTDDKLFPLSFGQEIADAAGVPLWVVNGASHSNVQVADLDGYVARLAILAKKVRESKSANR